MCVETLFTCLYVFQAETGKLIENTYEFFPKIAPTVPKWESGKANILNMIKIILNYKISYNIEVSK